jgi:hypothetical protein
MRLDAVSNLRVDTRVDQGHRDNRANRSPSYSLHEQGLRQ